MRLIDADELKKKLYKDTTGWSHGEHPLIVEESDIDDCETIDAIPISFIIEEEQKLRNENNERDIPLTTPIIEANMLEALIEAWRNRNDS